jgi:hypothetical protein
MTREYEESKIFSDNLDRLISGGEVKVESANSREILEALDFAKKLNSLRSEPSFPFKTHLKAKLLQELSDREGTNENRQNRFGQVLRGQPIWLTAAVCAALLIVVGSVLWKTGVFTPPGSNWSSLPSTTVTTTTATTTTATTTQTSTVERYLLADASVDKPVYQSGETVKINVALTNISGLPFTLTQFPPILSLMESGTKQAVFTFTSGKESRTIEPWQKTNFTLNWNQTDAQGNRVKSGKYYIELEDLDLQGKAVKLNLTRPAEFEILPSY